jgi:SIR2-like domain
MTSTDPVSPLLVPPPAVGAADDATIRRVADYFLSGKVVPFLGAGVNLNGRDPQAQAYDPNGMMLPLGFELSQYLAKRCQYPGENRNSLTRVAQYYALQVSAQAVFDEVRAVLDRDFPLTPVHQFLAALTTLQGGKGRLKVPPLVITTNYDDLLERAYRAANVEFDLISYVTDSDETEQASCLFEHVMPDGTRHPITEPNSYHGLNAEKVTFNFQRPVILKIHGTIDRALGGEDHDSYVISEDHYIDYFSGRSSLGSFLPAEISAHINTKSRRFLFLGYSLGDWNLQVLLRLIWKNNKRTKDSLSVQWRPDPFEILSWRSRGVMIFHDDVQKFIGRVQEEMSKP